MKIQYKDKIIEAEAPITINELLEYEIKESEYTVVAGLYNNQYINLEYPITEDGTVDLIDVSSKAGMKIYARTLIYVLQKAFQKVCPGAKMSVNYQLANAVFCDINEVKVTEELVKQLSDEVREIIHQNLPIKQIKMNREKAKEFYEKTGTSRGRLQYDLEENEEIYMYYCEEYYNYCYGTMGNRTGVLKLFEILKYEDGFLVRYPTQYQPNQLPRMIPIKKLSWALNEYDDIHKILDMDTVYKLNSAVEENRIKDVIMTDEALHEKKIANIADEIAKNRNIKMILIAGPSSSGKTTFAQRLGIQLKLNRIKPVTISVDNYFVERKDTPRDEEGNYDFECIEAIDIELFNNHLTKLLNGEEVEMPQFDFREGTKKYTGNKLRLKDDEVLVIEGIHCLNDKLTSKIAKSQKYKIYISALTVLNMDRFTRISSSDTRLVRRIVRDYQFRGYNAKNTIESWKSVNRGEEKNIFPFQEEADIIFNTSLIYELAVLKGVAIPILDEIKQEEKEYAEANRLKDMLKYFKTIPTDYVPTNSLLKEFIGGGNFKY